MWILENTRILLFDFSLMLFKFAGNMYKLVLELARQSNLIVTNTPIENYTSKIYAFIGIVMLFRMAIILLQYIANPEKVMDAKNGIGPHVATHILTVLVLLVTVPFGFDLLYQFQEDIIVNNVMTNFFADDIRQIKLEDASKEETAAEKAAKITNTTPMTGGGVHEAMNDDLESKPNTTPPPTSENIANSEAVAKYIGTSTGNQFTDILAVTFYQPNPDLWADAKSIEQQIKDGKTFDGFFDTIFGSNEGEALEEYFTEVRKINNPQPNGETGFNYVVLRKNINKTATWGIFENEYIFEFNGFMAILMGIAVIILMASVLLKISLRIFQLLFLEILAPIPIIMYLDPSIRKKGETALERWFKSLIKTYADLFIRVLTVLFLTVLMRDIFSYMGTIQADSLTMLMMLRLFLLLGIIFFMSFGPDFVMGIFGMQADKGPLSAGAIGKRFMGSVTGQAGASLKSMPDTVRDIRNGNFRRAATGFASAAGLGFLTGFSANKANAWGAGRDAVGKAQATGPGATGSFITRGTQRQIQRASRGEEEDIIASIREHAENHIDRGSAARDNYDTARRNLNTATGELANMQQIREEILNRLRAAEAQGDQAAVMNIALELETQNNNISAQQTRVETATETLRATRTILNNNVADHNRMNEDLVDVQQRNRQRYGRDSDPRFPDADRSNRMNNFE